jgi:hypothetical protein
MYPMTTIFFLFLSFFADLYQKDAEFSADFKSVEIIGKKCTQKNLFAKNFQVTSKEEDKLQFCTVFCLYLFCWQVFSIFLNSFKISVKWVDLKPIFKFCEEKVFCHISTFLNFKAVLRIHDILGWIRIRIWIRGSMPLTNGSGSGCGSGSCYFRHWPSQDANKKLIFKKVFLLITFWRYMYIIFKDKKSKRSRKAVGSKVFITFFAWW